MTQFKKGDRVQKVAPHNAIRDGENDSNGPDTFAREAAMGALGTVIGTAATHLYIKWDGGNTSCVPREVVAPAENHGTGDGSASDICAEPGCNCDLERRFPAPLDPAKVKAGDTVTVHVSALPDMPDYDVTGEVYEFSLPGAGLPLHVGGHSLSDPSVTLTAHQPAAEPEPAPGYYTVHPTANPETAWTGLVFEDGSFVGEEDGFYRSASKGEFTVDSRLVVIDLAEVDVDALQAAVQEAWRTRTGDDAYEAAHAVLEHLGIEVPR